MRITSKKYETLQAGLRELYSHHSLDTLPKAALQLANALVPNDFSTYNEVDPSRRRLQVVFDPVERQAEVMQLITEWEKFMHQHPVLSHYVDNPCAGPHKISDFLTNERFRKLELYTEVYGKMDVNYQMAVNMHSPSPLVVAVALNRGAKDFNEVDRKLLSMLNPHLRQAYENATLVSELTEQLDRSFDVLDRMDRGLVVLDLNCRVKNASPTAIRFSLEQFRSDRSADLATQLPEQIKSWAMQQMAALRQESKKDARPKPLFLDGDGGRLAMRIVPDRAPNQFIIVMRRLRPLESSEPLQDLGLTNREAEVLRCMVNDESNSEIGSELGISGRTVDKHCQNIYTKLGVPGRREAISRALEWLRL